MAFVSALHSNSTLLLPVLISSLFLLSWLHTLLHQVACVAVGGNLASIHTEDHYNFVKGLIKTSAGTNKQTWVGGTDAEGVWLWSDGSNFDFTFWGPRQPDNAGRSEDCMALVNKGVANDMPCTQKKSYICGRGLCGRRTPASDGRFFSI
uniref:C-type lectin domain-containing protein n=1 Tax=Monopterus albus TaxID=43700 RepID=A0A3Q3K647_MONAL